MTNLDKLRQMSAEQVAVMMTNINCLYCAYRGKCRPCDIRSCPDGIKAWLESEADNDGQD